MVYHDFNDIFMIKTMAVQISSFVKIVQLLYIFIGLLAFFFWFSLSALCNKCSTHINIFVQSLLPITLLMLSSESSLPTLTFMVGAFSVLLKIFLPTSKSLK